jgi:hypothetical protein
LSASDQRHAKLAVKRTVGCHERLLLKDGRRAGQGNGREFDKSKHRFNAAAAKLKRPGKTGIGGPVTPR